MRVGQSRKRDANEQAICDALADIAVDTIKLSAKGCPDVLAWSKWDGLRLLEVKQPKGELTPAQIAMRQRIPFTIVRSVEEALALYGVKA